MTGLNPFRLGVFAAGLAIVMILVEALWRPVFTVQITSGFALPLWILVAIYATLQFIVWQATSKRLTLSDAEVAEWGAKLEAATPEILKQISARTRVREIAESLEASEGIPTDVTLRYIIAMGSVQEGHSAEAG